MNHEDLLRKFLQFLVEYESIDFTDRLNDFCTDIRFTDGEVKELQRLSAEADEARLRS